MSTTEVIDETDGGKSPDHSICWWCKEPITWCDYTYAHDAHGFVECGLVISGGTPLTVAQHGLSLVGGQAAINLPVELPVGAIIDPDLTLTLPPDKQTRAEPVEWAGWKLSAFMARWWVTR
jgi:hypothetical protein